MRCRSLSLRKLIEISLLVRNLKTRSSTSDSKIGTVRHEQFQFSEIFVRIRKDQINSVLLISPKVSEEKRVPTRF